MTSYPASNSPWIAACETELIHLPGAVQAWGALLVANEPTLIVQHASANLDNFIGCTAEAAIGQNLGAMLDPATLAPLLTSASSGQAPGAVAAELHPGGRLPDAGMSSHRLNGALYIEIELQPAFERGSSSAWSDTRMIVESLRGAATTDALLRTAAGELRRATGFDRAMVYRFDAGSMRSATAR